MRVHPRLRFWPWNGARVGFHRCPILRPGILSIACVNLRGMLLFFVHAFAIASPSLTSLLQLLIALGKDRLFATMQFVARRDVAQGAVQSDFVVLGDVIGNQTPGVFQRQRCARPDAIALDRAMIAFQLAVALRVIGRSPHVRHAANADKLLEVLGDELRAVVADDPRRLVGELFTGPLEDRLDVLLGHRLTDFPMHDVTAVTVQNATHIVKSAAEVQVRDVDVPMTVRAVRLVEALAFLRRFAVVSIEDACRFSTR